MSENRNTDQDSRKSSSRLNATTTVAVLLLAGCFLSLFAITNTRANELSGKQVYQYNCALCHKTGLNGAPKYGNDKLWKPRISKEKEKVYENALHGKGAMPPKGGHPNLTDEEVKSAVDYMVRAVGGWPDSG